jgi:hypothetical protein
MHKITYADLARQVAQTMKTLPDADWNDQPSVPAARRGRATWGPHSQGNPLVYDPRFKTDHHPWRVNGTEGTGAIRYAGNEVEEAQS